jgi:hypothetical protein
MKPSALGFAMVSLWQSRSFPRRRESTPQTFGDALATDVPVPFAMISIWRPQSFPRKACPELAEGRESSR